MYTKPITRPNNINFQSIDVDLVNKIYTSVSTRGMLFYLVLASNRGHIVQGILLARCLSFFRSWTPFPERSCRLASL
jgi:hypothetical protein